MFKIDLVSDRRGYYKYSRYSFNNDLISLNRTNIPATHKSSYIIKGNEDYLIVFVSINNKNVLGAMEPHYSLGNNDKYHVTHTRSFFPETWLFELVPIE